MLNKPTQDSRLDQNGDTPATLPGQGEQGCPAAQLIPAGSRWIAPNLRERKTDIGTEEPQKGPHRWSIRGVGANQCPLWNDDPRSQRREESSRIC